MYLHKTPNILTAIRGQDIEQAFGTYAWYYPLGWVPPPHPFVHSLRYGSNTFSLFFIVKMKNCTYFFGRKFCQCPGSKLANFAELNFENWSGVVPLGY